MLIISDSRGSGVISAAYLPTLLSSKRPAHVSTNVQHQSIVEIPAKVKSANHQRTESTDYKNLNYVENVKIILQKEVFSRYDV